MTETENPTPNPDFEAAVQEKLRQAQDGNNADPIIEVPEDSIVTPETEVKETPEPFDPPTDDHVLGEPINEAPVDPTAIPEVVQAIKDNPQDPINNPTFNHADNPGEGNPEALHPVTDDDFIDQKGDEHAEQLVDKAGRPAGFNEFYHGDHLAKPENPNLYFLPSDEYEQNKNRENR